MCRLDCSGSLTRLRSLGSPLLGEYGASLSEDSTSGSSPGSFKVFRDFLVMYGITQNAATGLANVAPLSSSST